MVKGLKHLSYVERLQKRSIIQACKIMHEREKVNRENMFSISHNTGTWGNIIQLVHNRFKMDKRYLLTKVIKLCFSLPLYIVMATRIHGFNSKLD